VTRHLGRRDVQPMQPGIPPFDPQEMVEPLCQLIIKEEGMFS
jgi:hypothetical protein